MREAWRIVREKHSDTAFTGEGAARTGGRWNSRGVPVVYTSGTMALAALEVLVHLNPPVLFNYVAIRLHIEEKFIEHAELAGLPPDWRSHPPPPSTKQIGDAWVRSRRSAVLALPSVIVPNEWNYLLNPAHPDFVSIAIGLPERFAFDPRLLT